MSENVSGYYYKEVEVSASKLANLLAELNTYFDSDSLNELIGLLSNIPWAKLSKDYSDGYAEDLTDEQKEEIALVRKGWKEDIEHWTTALKPYLANVKAFYETVGSLCHIRQEALASIVKYDYSVLKELCDNMPPLRLTSKELYHTLTFFDENQIRNLLSNQTPVVFNRMLTAFQKGEKDFVRIIDDLNYEPILGLREILMIEMEKVSSFSEFASTQAQSDRDLTLFVNEELCEICDCDIDAIIATDSFDLSIETLASQQKLLSSYLQSQASALYHSSIVTQSGRRMILKLYEDWRKCNPSCPPFDECAPIDYTNRLMRIITNQMDKWILSTIQNRMSRETLQMNDEDVTAQPSTVDYREFYALVAPSVSYETMRKIAARLAGKERVGNTIQQSQVAYIKVCDMVRLCYFFLHKVCPPDKIENIDFSKPIQWLGNWESLRYFVYQLYGKPTSFPSNLSKDITEVFRFKSKRQRNKEIGKIAESTFNDHQKIFKDDIDEDRKRIGSILKELGLS